MTPLLIALVIEGSSPLTRGKRVAKMQSRDLPRLIPAHAGKTHFPVQDSNALRAHPRSRGENVSIASSIV